MASPALPRRWGVWAGHTVSITTTKENIMGDKGGKKDKEKLQKQKASKQAVKDKQKQDKQVKKV
jgi:hypothetical protein